MSKYNDTEVLVALKKPLPVLEREGRKGQFYKYIPTKFVSDRLLEVWGLDWDFEILGDPIIQFGHVAVKIRLHHPSDTGPRFKDAFGGAQYEDKIGLGDICKKATSLALKKAASLVGIDLQDEEVIPITEEQKGLIIKCLKHLGKNPDDEQLKMIEEMSTGQADETIQKLTEQIQEKKNKE